MEQGWNSSGVDPRGIGRGCAVALAEAGCDIALGLRSVNRDDGVKAEVEQLGRAALPLQMDVTSKDEIDSAVAQTLERFGRIDILVNNAGGGRLALAADVTEKDFDDLVGANLRGTFFASQAVYPAMCRQGGGRIINIGSQAGAVALREESVYCASKAAVAHLTKCLALEWGPNGINVNCVAPTFIRTPGTAPALSDPDFHQHVLDMIPLGCVGEVSDVTGAVVFLAGPQARMITGATLLIDGGWTIH